mmetsp:Transcript_20174/g.35882  ORF Transcript_20174/g.35882 Transcript_20174/m.35882 type:complete len:462 (+) Transcript_20174:77-1462(+)
MRSVEGKVRALLMAYCNTERYISKSAPVEFALFLLQLLMIVLTVLALRCTTEHRGALWAWALLWFSQTYLTFVTFAGMHEWRHGNLSSQFMSCLYFLVGWVATCVNPADIFSYYVMGHLQHHGQTGRTCILDFVRQPWWEGKDADVLLFGLTGKSPFKNLGWSPMPMFIFFWMALSSAGFIMIVTTLTLGTVCREGISKDSASVLVLQAVRFYLMFWHSGPEGWWYPFPTLLVFIVFSMGGINFSMLAFYVPLTHPDKKSQLRGLHMDLESRYAMHYPTFTPEFPAWVHNYVFFGLTYHIEHHAFPLTPWYRLQLVHDDLQLVARDSETYPQPKIRSMDREQIPNHVMHPSELQKHASASSLWVAIDGVVLDLTAWFKNHPGGSELLLQRAGREISEAYYAQHKDLSNVMAHLHCGIAIVGILSVEDDKEKIANLDEQADNLSSDSEYSSDAEKSYFCRLR